MSNETKKEEKKFVPSCNMCAKDPKACEERTCPCHNFGIDKRDFSVKKIPTKKEECKHQNAGYNKETYKFYCVDCGKIEGEETKKCQCPSKYCEHYESDFDRFLKENPIPTGEEKCNKCNSKNCTLRDGMCLMCALVDIPIPEKTGEDWENQIPIIYGQIMRSQIGSQRPVSVIEAQELLKDFISSLLLFGEKQWKDEMVGEIKKLRETNTGQCDCIDCGLNCSDLPDKANEIVDLVLSLLSNNQEDK